MPEQAARPRSGMRGRLVAAGGALGAAVVLGCALPALAEEGASVPVTQCSITDPALPELSGLVVVGDRMLALNDGGDQLTVHLLDAACQIVDGVSAPIDPYDPEDLARAADGTVWVADTGDNNAARPTVALLALRPDGSHGVYRLTYPDRPHDAEALFLAPDGTPYIVTKEILGASKVYRPAAPLVDGGTVALVEVAAVNLTLTGTPGGRSGRPGSSWSRGARSPRTDGTSPCAPTPTPTCGR
ncbi:esterase-like activity of phytase family protein [Blastococcus sp. PRF04-17]|uniref:esterase-like activity of phytase family protein n=1 Tax=Blastococcus sp. PRF04-17 TaxID=2933797 RepID=UPI001FF4A0C6|nr:esterase-like activity of phytase family protein [Blastococcus sp. PRF04-17]UOY01627.1 esterase-like activity of phytase family protein [Blastococcus sp. PRF04-17]